MELEAKTWETKFLHVFIFFMGIAGMFIAFLVPPNAVPDETIHYLKAYSVSQLQFFPAVNEETGKMGQYYPEYIVQFIESYNSKYTGKLEEKMTFSETYFDSWLPVSDDSRNSIFYESEQMVINSWSYLISGIGMKIWGIMSHLFGDGYDNGYNLLLAGRLANLLFYILAGSYAVKITPCLKKTMLLLFSMPVSLFLGASLSYDAIVIPVSMLFFAELMNFILNKEKMVRTADIVIIGAVTFFLTATKIAYAPFLLLLFFIPFRQFHSKKQYWISIVTVVIAGSAAYVIPTLIRMIVTRNAILNVQPEIAIQKEYFLSHLWKIPSILLETLHQYGSFYAASFYGKVGVLDTNLPLPFFGLFYIVLIVIVLYEVSCAGKITWKFRLASVVIFAAIIIGIFSAMYLSWTPLVEEPMGNTVSGVQGRYFIPLFCFGGMILFNNIHQKLLGSSEKISQRIDAAFANICKIWCVFDVCILLCIVLLRYWV